MSPSEIISDSNPLFISEFYTNLRILNQDLYKRLTPTNPSSYGVNTATSVVLEETTASIVDEYSRKSLSRNPNGRSSTDLNILGNFDKSGHRRLASGEIYFNTQALQERIKQYAKKGGVSQGGVAINDYFIRYGEEEKNSVIGLQKYEKKDNL